MKWTLDGIEIFPAGEQDPAFTFSINELTDPSKIRGTRSTTTKVVNTKALRRVIGSDRMLSSRRSDRPVLRRIDGGIEQFAAPSIASSHDEDIAEILALGGNSAWIEWAQKTKLNTFDFGDTEPLTRAAQEASWTDEDALVHYPLINHGGLTDRSGVYNVSVSRLRPAFRVHRVLEETFASQGYRVAARGRLAREWKKYGIYQPTERPVGSAAYLASQSAVLSTASGYPYTDGPNNKLPTDTVDTDPSGIATIDTITPANPHRYRVTLNAEFYLTRTSLFSPYRILVFVRNLSTLQTVVQHIREIPSGSLTETIKFSDQVLGEFDATAGDQYAVTAFMVGAGTYTLNVADIEIRWDCVAAEYVENVSVEIRSCMPRFSVLDLVTGLVRNRVLVVDTDATTRTVNFFFFDDYFTRPGLRGRMRDWTDRLDTTKPPSKEADNAPSVIRYRMQEDKDDAAIAVLTAQGTAPGFGNADEEVGGYENERDVTVPWAPTAMGFVFDTQRVPVMLAKGGDYQVDDFDREPRFLIFDGVSTDGGWTHDGVPTSTYPKVYFSHPDAGSLPVGFGNNLVFGDEQGGGTLEAYGRKAAALRLSRMIEVNVLIYPHEMIRFDHGVPTLFDDGSGPAWYYVQEVRNFRFRGRGLSTTCLLVEIPGANVDADAVSTPTAVVTFPPPIVGTPFPPYDPCTYAARFPNTPVLVQFALAANSQATVEADTVNFPIGTKIFITGQGSASFNDWEQWTGSIVERVAPGTGTGGTAWLRTAPASGTVIENADFSSATEWDRYLLAYAEPGFSSGAAGAYYLFKPSYLDGSGNYGFSGIENVQAETTNGAYPVDACRRVVIQFNNTTNPSTGWVDAAEGPVDFDPTNTFSPVTIPPGALYYRAKYIRGAFTQGYSDRQLV